VRLRRSDVTGRGLTRRRHGRGFSYVDQDGRPVSAADRARIRALVIPPAWRDVWICPWPNGHIQAIGVDDADRRQYLYHVEWRRQRDARKHDRVLALAPRLPDFRKRVADDLASRGFTGGECWQWRCACWITASSGPVATRADFGVYADPAGHPWCLVWNT
jgi:DNA topoisomerase IB